MHLWALAPALYQGIKGFYSGVDKVSQKGADFIVNSAKKLDDLFKSEDFQNFVGWGTERRNREYETELANTAYQRQVDQMQAIGLNPYLAYQQGGAYVPQVASGQSHFGDILKLVGTALMLSKGISSSAKGLAGTAKKVTVRNYFYK